jgi:hypothetical protein
MDYRRAAASALVRQARRCNHTYTATARETPAPAPRSSHAPRPPPLRLRRPGVQAAVLCQPCRVPVSSGNRENAVVSKLQWVPSPAHESRTRATRTWLERERCPGTRSRRISVRKNAQQHVANRHTATSWHTTICSPVESCSLIEACSAAPEARKRTRKHIVARSKNTRVRKVVQQLWSAARQPNQHSCSASTFGVLMQVFTNTAQGASPNPRVGPRPLSLQKRRRRVRPLPLRLVDTSVGRHLRCRPRKGRSTRESHES